MSQQKNFYYSVFKFYDYESLEAWTNSLITVTVKDGHQ